MDRGEFRQYVRAQLAGLPREVVAAFAARTALRVLPFLAHQHGPDAEIFSYWQTSDRGKHLLAVFSACNVALLFACGEPGLHLVSLAARRAAAAAAAANAAANAAYAAAYAAYAAADAADAAAAAYAAYAAADAAYAAYAAYAADRHYIISAIKNDLLIATNAEKSNAEFITQPLWPFAPSAALEQLHQALQSAAIQLDPGFGFWLDFYQDRLDGKPLDLALMRQAALLPETIQSQTCTQINAYLLNLRNQLATQPLNRVRAIFLGDGEAGKTSLVKVLFGEDVHEAKEPMTPGIDIREWPVPDTAIKAHFWDFGGQVMMHATHQLFLREACLYVLVMNSRSETNATEQAQYWLEHVKAFGGQSAVLVVENRLDQASLNLDHALLKQKYPNIAGFFPLSCTQAKGAYQSHAQAFLRAFCSQLQALETHQVKFTQPQFTVLENLRQRTPQAAFLSQDEFIAMCAEQNITEAGTLNRDWLLKILDTLGVIIHFKELACLDGYVLNPRWLTYGIYTLMCHQQPKLTERAIVDLLREKKVEDEHHNVLTYPADKCRFIMDAMCQFKLGYRLHDKANTLIIPGLLSATQPAYQFDQTTALAFEFSFAVFLPRHIMPQLIVQRHQEIVSQNTENGLQQIVWQAGVLLASPHQQASALLITDYHERKIQLWVTGSAARDYLTILRHDILGILNDVKLRYEELIMLPQSARMNNVRQFYEPQGAEQASYRQVLAHANNGVKSYIAASGNQYDVAAVLRTFIPEEEQARQIVQQFNQIFLGENPNIMANQGANMNNKVVNNSGTIHGNVTVADTISNSFNKLADSPAAPDIKALLEQLLKEIETLKSAATPAQQEAVTDLANDAQGLVTETARSAPRPDRLGVSLKGIRDAAQTVGEIGSSVLETAQKLAPLLGLL